MTLCKTLRSRPERAQTTARTSAIGRSHNYGSNHRSSTDLCQARAGLAAFLLALGLALALPGMANAQQLNGFDLSDALIPAAAIERGGPPRDGIPAIDKPRFVPASRAGLADDDRVLGLAHGGVARAYPVAILNWHEVVNDRVAGLPVAVTYCPLCGTGVAFDARLGGAGKPAAVFAVSGLLYNSDVLLYDRGTESLWSQLMFQAVSGPLKGQRLRRLPISHTSWADWRSRHPGTEVLSRETGFDRDYGRDPYAGYDQVARLMFEVQHRDDRLPAKDWVLGLQVGDAARAYPLSLLASRVDAQGRLRDSLGGQSVEIRYNAQHRSAEAFDAKGRPLAAVMAYWFAWFAFHPQTTLLPAP